MTVGIISSSISTKVMWPSWDMNLWICRYADTMQGLCRPNKKYICWAKAVYVSSTYSLISVYQLLSLLSQLYLNVLLNSAPVSPI